MSHCLIIVVVVVVVVLVAVVVFVIEKFVTCGSVVKLTHVESGSKFYLHSEDKNLGGGSGQQIVTWRPEKATTSTLWWIREGHDDDYCETAKPLSCGLKVRLTHLDTMRNLHTHAHQSPLSKQQEISCFGNDGNGDASDDWIVECSSSGGVGEFWKRNQKVRLLHVATQKYLGGSSQVQFTPQNCGSGCPIMNHLEAFGRQRADDYSEFKVEMGVYLSK
jgi:dolichyl-phosphate-mannose--protein O-mannosyl transferase